MDRRTQKLLFGLIALLLALTVHRLGCASVPNTPASAAASEQRYETRGPIMGTTYSVIVVGDVPLLASAQSVVDETVSSALQEVNGLMSTYEASSEVSRFNRSRGLEHFGLSPSTCAVLTLAQSLSRRSEGAFDVTVGPLVAAWGFGAGASNAHAGPPAAELEGLQAYVGYEGLTLDSDACSLTKRDARMQIDLSAVAKGYAVDLVVRRLDALGYTNFLVEVGGELAARGRREDGSLWRVGIERPDTPIRSIYRVVPLDDMAMATSGDYRNFRILEEGQVAHIIDPRSGAPVRHRLTSVTVFHENAAMADALATTLAVLGPNEGLAWSEVHAILALFIERASDGTLESSETSALQAYWATYGSG